MLCISCLKWGHLNCTNVPESFFRSDSDWICDVCLWKELPSSECRPTSPSFTVINDKKENLDEQTDQSIISHDLDVVKNDLDRLQSQKGLKLGHLNCLSLKKHMKCSQS